MLISMTRRAITPWLIVLCLLGQVVMSLTAGARMCFACGPTFCTGIDLLEQPVEKACCCDTCKEKEQTPAPRPPHRCCCGEAIPMPHDERRAEPLSNPTDHRFVFQPLVLDLVASLVRTHEPPSLLAACITDSLPRRISDGITSTRLLI